MDIKKKNCYYSIYHRHPCVIPFFVITFLILFPLIPRFCIPYFFCLLKKAKTTYLTSAKFVEHSTAYFKSTNSVFPTVYLQSIIDLANVNKMNQNENKFTLMLIFLCHIGNSL